MLPAALFALALAAAGSFPLSARAQDAQDAVPAVPAIPADPGNGNGNANGNGSGDGQGGAGPDPFQSRQNARRRVAAPRPPLPDYAPQLEKRGEDLVVHAPGGDVEYPAFLHGLSPDEQRAVNLVIPQHGNCVLQVDLNATLVSMTCEK